MCSFTICSSQWVCSLLIAICTSVFTHLAISSGSTPSLHDQRAINPLCCAHTLISFHLLILPYCMFILCSLTIQVQAIVALCDTLCQVVNFMYKQLVPQNNKYCLCLQCAQYCHIQCDYIHTTKFEVLIKGVNIVYLECESQTQSTQAT